MSASLIFFIIFFQGIPIINPQILVWLGCVTPQIENRWESLLNSTFAAIWANKKCLNDLSHQSYVIFTKFDGFLEDMLTSQISLDTDYFFVGLLVFLCLTHWACVVRRMHPILEWDHASGKWCLLITSPYIY